MNQKKNLEKGILITFEGIDGSGKTTIINKIRNNKIIQSLNPIFTKEPNELYETYNLLKSSLHITNIDPIVELFLFMANHAEHINNIIKPNIENKKIIFCDRYIDSRCAYQGATLSDIIKNPIEYISSIHKNWSIIPNLTFFVNVNISTSIYRCNKRNKLDKFETEKFLKIVDTNFKKIINSDPKRFIVLDGTKNIDDLEKIVIDSVLKYINYI